MHNAIAHHLLTDAQPVTEQQLTLLASSLRSVVQHNIAQ